MGVLGEWWPLLAAVGIGLMGWGAMQRNDRSHSKNIESLWDKKADADKVHDLKVKQEGMDRWMRDHEEKSNAVRLEFAQRFASIEKAIEIGMNNHEQILSLVGRLELAIDKMEKRFESLVDKVESALLHKGGM